MTDVKKWTPKRYVSTQKLGTYCLLRMYGQNSPCDEIRTNLVNRYNSAIVIQPYYTVGI